MSSEACEAMCRAVRYVTTPEESKRLSTLRVSTVLISASGIAAEGCVLCHLKAFLPDARNTILLSPGTRRVPRATGAPWYRSLTAGFLWLCASGLAASPTLEEDLRCTPLSPAVERPVVPAGHSHGLLWRISKAGKPAGYLFGTIHLGDAALVDLPEPVSAALTSSPSFVMEARLDAEDLTHWSRSMLDSDPGALRARLGGALFERAMALLAQHHIPDPVAAQLKPWAVFLTLSTPPDIGGLPLDLVLAARAMDAGKPVSGLESAAEQADVVAKLPIDEQVALVRDAVCHYATLQADVAETKQLYLDRDLAGLAVMAQRYALSESPRYRHLMDQMLWQRNARMVDRIEPHLAAGGAFIAVGALHLPGARGLLGLLETRGYAIESVY